MKKIYLLLITLMPIFLMAQTVRFSDDFENQPLSWVNSGGNWEWGVPNQDSLNLANSGSKVWMTRLDSNYLPNSVSYLISPDYDFSNITNAELSFFHKFQFGTNDGGLIEYSTDTGSTWIALGYIGDLNSTNWYSQNINGLHCFGGLTNGWVNSKYNLSQFNNLNGLLKFRFKFFSDLSLEDEGWMIDDFSIIIPSISEDAGVIQIICTDTTVMSSSVVIEVIIKNFGTDTLFNIPLSYSLNQTTPIIQNFSSSGIAPSDTGHFIFNTNFISPVSNYSVCAKTQINGDIYNFNDEFCKNIEVSQGSKDVGVISIISPDSMTEYTIFYYEKVKVIIKNYGLDTIHSFEAGFYIKNITNITKEIVNGVNLPPGDTLIYTFNKYLQFPIGLFFIPEICIKTILSDDCNSSNDEKCVVLIIDGINNNENQVVFSLEQSIPNPSNGFAKIPYELLNNGDIKFEITDITGKKLVSKTEKKTAGKHYFEIDLSCFEAGIYYYSLEIEGYRKTRKLIINH